MRTGCFVIFALIELIAVGCRQSPHMSAHLQLMNAEKRAIEDELYELEYEYEDAIRELERMKKENNSLRDSAGLPRRDEEGSTRSNSSGRGSSRQKSDPMIPMIDEGTNIEPMIEMPSTQPSGELPKPNTNPARPADPPAVPGSGTQSKKNSAERKTPVANVAPNRNWALEPGDPRVSHIFLNPLLTGGTDLDREPGDDGLTVVIEPRNREEKFVPLAGPISVLVLDPEKTPEQGRVVARWEIAANTAQQSLQNTATTRGIHLKLPWPESPPSVSRLQLHVRYLTVDNRDLRADRELFITLPGQFSQRWTPRAGGHGPEPELPAENPTAGAASDPVAGAEWRPYR